MGPAASNHELHAELKTAVAELCRNFPDKYWRELDAQRAYPEEFVSALTKAGYLATLIPEEFGGAGLGVTEATIILEAIHRSGGNAGACHAQMYIMGTLLRHGSEEQKKYYLPQIARGDLRLQAFAVSEPTTGSDTTQLKTLAVRKGDRYVVKGQKIWISRAEHSDLMLLLARTTPIEEVKKRTEGLSILLVDLRQSVGNGLTIRPIRTMMNHATTEVFFDDLEVPAENLVGEEGQGFRYLLDGLNAERILIASECIGDGRWFLDRACRYAKERVVFNRPIGQNQGVQFPIARAHAAVAAGFRRAITKVNAARGGAYIEQNDQQEVIRGVGLAKGLGLSSSHQSPEAASTSRRAHASGPRLGGSSGKGRHSTSDSAVRGRTSCALPWRATRLAISH